MDKDAQVQFAVESRRIYRNIRHSLMVVDSMMRPDYFRDPEVIVAGIEGRAIVRAGMQRELRYIGEAS
jgi:hypothetical protein